MANDRAGFFRSSRPREVTDGSARSGDARQQRELREQREQHQQREQPPIDGQHVESIRELRESLQAGDMNDFARQAHTKPPQTSNGQQRATAVAVGYKPTQTGCCPLLHGTVYAEPYPGFVHGAHPEICKNGCKPLLRSMLNEAPEAALRREANEFIDLYAAESGLPPQEREARKLKIHESLAATGTYEHTFAELQWGIRTAWRNASGLANRKHWDELVLLDHRAAASPLEMFEGCKELLERTAQHRGHVPYLTAFRPRTPGTEDGPRIWNPQLLRFACYTQTDGTLLGDPVNKDLTEFMIEELAWIPPKKRSAFDVLPLALQIDPSQAPKIFELPPWYVPMVALKHDAASWLADLGLKWFGVATAAAQELRVGGLIYTAVPSTCWSCDSDVVHELASPSRYDLIKVVAECMALDTRSEATLWRDRAMQVLNEAVVGSFRSASWCMIDHHTMLNDFREWYVKEKAERGYCAGSWEKIVAPLNPTVSSFSEQLRGMTNFTLMPAYFEAPQFTHFKKLLQESRPQPGRKPAKALPFNPYVARMIGILKSQRGRLMPNLVILYAGESGSTKHYADRVASLMAPAFTVSLMPADNFNLAALTKASAVIQMTDTYGPGAPPAMARKWLSFLTTAEARQMLMGKPFATIGFGCKLNAPRFCAAAEMFAQVASEAGVRPLLRIGKCDTENNEEAHFRSWLSDLVDRLVKKRVLKAKKADSVSKAILVRGATSHSLRPAYKVVPVAKNTARAKEDRDRFAAPVKSNTSLLVRSDPNEMTCLVTLDLRKQPYLQYSPGDHLRVYPDNSPEVVASVGLHLGLSESQLDSLFSLEPLTSQAFERFPSPITFRNALTHYMDLEARPSIPALTTFAVLVSESDPVAAKELYSLVANSHEYSKWLALRQPRWRDVWDLFPALQSKLSPSSFFELCPIVAARPYAIASSLMATPKEVSIIVEQVTQHLPDGSKRHSPVSTLLTSAKQGDFVSFSIATVPSFHLPMDPACPAVFVAEGTGLAPFRAFWAERSARARYIKQMAPALLVFGCTSKEVNRKYLEEIDAALNSGGLTDVAYCFSHKPGAPPMLVQDGVAANGVHVAELLRHRNAHFYVSAGAATSAAVSAAVQSALGLEQCTVMQSEGRWHETVFGGTAGVPTDASIASSMQQECLKAMDWDLKSWGVQQAIRSGEQRSVRQKLEALSEDERVWEDPDGRNFLHHVVLENKPNLVAVVEVLTSRAAVADRFSLTPRALAVVLGRQQCATMLDALEGPQVSEITDGFFPVHAAVLKRDVATLKQSLQVGVDFTKQDNEGNLILHCAVAANDVEQLRLLLHAKAPVHLPNRYGRTAIQAALLLGFREAAAELKAAGAVASCGQSKHANFSSAASVPSYGSKSSSGVMNHEQVSLVQASWGYLTASIFPGKIREHLEDLGVKSFLELFSRQPQLLRIFPFKDEQGKPIIAELRKHALKVFVSISEVVGGLGELDKTSQATQSFIREHIKYGIKKEHYMQLMESVRNTVQTSLGVDAWTSALAEAWAVFLKVCNEVIELAYTGADVAEGGQTLQESAAQLGKGSKEVRKQPSASRQSSSRPAQAPPSGTPRASGGANGGAVPSSQARPHSPSPRHSSMPPPAAMAGAAVPEPVANGAARMPQH